MRAVGLFLFAVTLLACGPALAQQQGPPPPTKAEKAVDAQQFLIRAAGGHRFDMATAQLALERSQNRAVRTLAQALLADRDKLLDPLPALAQTHGVSLGEDLTPRQVRELARLRTLSGAQFDIVYVRGQLADQQKHLRSFGRMTRDTVPEDVRGYAEASIPVLKRHLQLAQVAQQSLQPQAATDGGR